MKSALIIGLIVALLFPSFTFAQTDPGQDPFAQNPNNMGLFEGYNAENPLNSLFNGDNQKDAGLFTQSLTQLGGATPYYELTQPERETPPGPAIIKLYSSYSPTGDLTSSSTITLTARVSNSGQSVMRDIQFHAVLQDKNAALTGEDPLSSNFAEEESSIDTELKSTTFTLSPGVSHEFTWKIKAHKDDSILRWRLFATFEAGESALLQWIPIKNPNPQMGGAPGDGGGGGNYLNPCNEAGGSGPFPDDATPQQLIGLFKQHWNIELVTGRNIIEYGGTPASFTDARFKGALRAWWEVLGTVECTPFLTDAFAGQPLVIEGYTGTSGWWGWYVGSNVQYMALDSISAGLVPQMKQNLIHELGHVWRGGQWNRYMEFENTICGRGSPHQHVSGYGDIGGCSEDMAETVGYYVARDSNEWGYGTEHCPGKNPFDWGQSLYYSWAKGLFGGREYGPTPPNPPTSC